MSEKKSPAEAMQDLVSEISVMRVEQQSLRGEMKEWVEKKSPTTSSQPSEIKSEQIEGVERRLGEIEQTLSEFVMSLDGKRLKSAQEELTKAAEAQTKAAKSATDQAEKLVSQSWDAAEHVKKAAKAEMNAYAHRIISRHNEEVEKSRKKVERAVEAAEEMKATLDTKRAWSAFAGICLGLMPVFATAFVLFFLASAVYSGWGWAVEDWDEAPWVSGFQVAFVLGLALAGACVLWKFFAWIADLWSSTHKLGELVWPFRKKG